MVSKMTFRAILRFSGSGEVEIMEYWEVKMRGRSGFEAWGLLISGFELPSGKVRKNWEV